MDPRQPPKHLANAKTLLTVHTHLSTPPFPCTYVPLFSPASAANDENRRNVLWDVEAEEADEPQHAAD